MRGNLSGTGEKHSHRECQKGALREWAARKELNDLVHVRDKPVRRGKTI